MARVLITGVAGFIGSTLARALLDQGASVCGLDNLSTGRMENIEEILEDMDFIRASVEDVDVVRHACKGIDYVFHQAAVPSVPASVLDPMGTNGPNLAGTLALLEAARHAGVKRLMYAASSAAYGDQAPDEPKAEAMLPAPISPYAVQKVAGEYYLASYARIYGLQTIALRYFNVFGPRQDPSSQYSGVLARFISQMTLGETPTIYGDGSASRDFTYVDNIVRANLLAATAPSCVSGKVFNIATGTRTTLMQAYQLIRRSTAYEGPVRFLADRRGDIRHSVADISRAEAMLGYKVTTKFEAGLEKTITWYRSQVQSSSPKGLPPQLPASYSSQDVRFA